MKTVYIKGIKKYNTSIYKGLKNSKLKEGVDFIIGLGGIDFALYWIGDHITIRDFKLAIGAKYVFKHRMKFYLTYDEMNPVAKQSNKLTKDDIELMNRVKDSIYHKN